MPKAKPNKTVYWLFYSSLDFDARIVKSTPEWGPMQFDPDFAGHYEGPFKTAKEARNLGIWKSNDDAMTYRSMAEQCRSGTIEDKTK
jgi:hypothetical protein